LAHRGAAEEPKKPAVANFNFRTPTVAMPTHLSATTSLDPRREANARGRLMNALVSELAHLLPTALGEPPGHRSGAEPSDTEASVPVLALGGDITATALMEQDLQIREWLFVTNDRTALNAYLLGQGMSDLIHTPAGEMKARWGDIHELDKRLESLAELLPVGFAAALRESLHTWQQEVARASAERLIKLEEVAAPRTAEMWQQIVFGSGLSISSDQEQFLAELTEDLPVKAVLATVVAFVLVVLIAATALYALTGSGTWWERVAAGVLGAAGVAFAMASGVTRWIRGVWQSTVGAWVQAKRVEGFYGQKLQDAFEDLGGER
jgi:hypothetical protein